MINKILLLGLLSLLMNGCTSAVPSQPVLQQDPASPLSSPTIVGVSQTVSPATVSPTRTALPSPTPSPSPTPAPVGISSGSFTDFAVTFQYLTGLKKAIKNLNNDYWLDGVAISPDGQYIAIGGCTITYQFACPNDVFGSYAFLVILDANTGETISLLPVKEVTITGVQFSPDSSQLIYAAYPQRVVIWDITGEKIERTIFNDKQQRTKIRIKVSPDGKWVAVSSLDGLRILDYANGKMIKELPGVGYVPQFSADSSRLAMNSAKGGSELTVYDTASWEVVNRIPMVDVTDRGYSMELSPDGKWMITKPESGDPVIRLWDANTGKQVKTLDKPAGRVLSMEFSPDNKMFFISYATDLEAIGKISVWDASTWQPLGVLSDFSENGSLAFTANGEYMLASNGRDIWRWSRMDEQVIHSRKVVVDFFDALGRGDFADAATLYLPDEYELENLRSIGLDTSDTVSMLEQICADETRICLPVLNVLPGGGLSQFDEYEVHVQFRAPDGSPFKNPSGITDHYIFLGMDADQNMKVNFIPYNE